MVVPRQGRREPSYQFDTGATEDAASGRAARPCGTDCIRQALLGILAPVREVALYLAAGVVYVAIGVAFPEFLFAWVVGVGFLLVSVVVVPALVERFRQ